ncbi:hypothetical protein AFK68_25685 [Hydrocoleum sp. CS-953]|nr:hypothetical protein AFK68_25685 [Hydrocoleum sp. CS-953]
MATGVQIIGSTNIITFRRPPRNDISIVGLGLKAVLLLPLNYLWARAKLQTKDLKRSLSSTIFPLLVQNQFDPPFVPP